MVFYRPPAPKIQEQDLVGKLAIVTGATKGIGRAIALDLATRGCSILGTYSSPESAHNFDTLSHTIQDLYSNHKISDPMLSAQFLALAPKLKGVVADITSLPSVDTVLADLRRFFGFESGSENIDILILNAAVNLRPKLGTATDADIQKSLVGNLQWPIVLVENLAKQRLFSPYARVVVMSSDRVRDPAPGASIFNATKSGLESLAHSWAIELPLKFPGTTVNAVSVGLTDTPGLQALPPAAVEAIKAERIKKVKVVEGGRMGFPEDVADVVGWLVSEKARWQTGSVVAANGGAEWIGGP